MKTKIILFAVLLFIVHYTLCIENCKCQWVQVFNNSGGTNNFTTLAADSDFIYAATTGGGTTAGLYRSSNNGLNWTLISLQNSGGKYLVKSGSNLIAVSGSTSTLMYSGNQGLNWTNTGLNNCVDLAAYGSLLLTVSQSAVWKSVNYGVNWNQLPTTGLSGPLCTEGLDSFVFATNTSGVMFRISTNTTSWISVNTGLPTPVEYSVNDIKSLHRNVFCSVHGVGGTGINSGIYKTTNNGNNWFRLVNTGPFLSAGPNLHTMDSVILYCISNTIYVSKNFGSNWTSKSANLPVGTTVNSFAYNPNYVFIGTSNGVWRMSKTEFLTNVKLITVSVPEKYSLSQNYPNPFNQSTMFNIQCPMAGIVQVKVFDMLGREIATLVNEYMNPGTYEVRFEASDLMSGVYFYRLSAGNIYETKKFVLMK